ncbi:MAG: IS256 family transposase [Bacteroidota bacterium]
MSIEDAFISSFKDVLQELLEAEIDSELGYSKYDWKNKRTGNSRNGHTKKTVRSQFGNVTVKFPRDTQREYEPVAVKKHSRTISNSINDMVISMYAKGMSNRDIASHLQSIYKLDVSADMITRITDKVLPLAREWQNRPLEPIYPILYLDGMVFNVLQDGHISKKTAYMIYGINLKGRKQVLGIWIGEHESSKFWMNVLTDMKNSDLNDILIASIDGLKGFEDAVRAVYPNVEIKRCIVHQVRYSTRFVSYKDRKKFCSDMKAVYRSPNRKEGERALDAFEKNWGKKYQYSVRSWRNNWESLGTLYKYPHEIRKLIYTTNPIENFNRIVRKSTKNRGSFPTDDSLFKLLYLVVLDSSKKWTVSMHGWTGIINQLNVYFGDRVEKYIWEVV